MAVSPTILAWLGVPEGEVPADQHRKWRRSDPRFDPAMRVCLGPLCIGRRRFQSEHAGHRICPACRASLRRLGGVHFHDGDGPPS